eukprot:31283-Pelagococcus_subviridis.AAC.6
MNGIALLIQARALQVRVQRSTSGSTVLPGRERTGLSNRSLEPVSRHRAIATTGSRGVFTASPATSTPPLIVDPFAAFAATPPPPPSTVVDRPLAPAPRCSGDSNPSSILATSFAHSASATLCAVALNTALSSGVRSRTAAESSSNPSFAPLAAFATSASASAAFAAGSSRSRTLFANAASCGESPTGVRPVANTPRRSDATASGSSSASPERTTAASSPRLPRARSVSEIAKSSSSRVSLGAIASRTSFGLASAGVGGSPDAALLGTKIGPGRSSGFGSFPTNGRSNGSDGGCGNAAMIRPPDFRAPCRNKTSAAPIASRSNTFRSDSARSERRYRTPVSSEMESSGIVSRSTNAPSLWSLATTPIALLSITARRCPWRMFPPPTVEA